MFTDRCIDKVIEIKPATHNNAKLAAQKQVATDWVINQIAEKILANPVEHIKAKNYYKFISSQVNKKLGLEFLDPMAWEKAWKKAVEETEKKKKTKSL